MLVSATRLKLSSSKFLMQFLFYTWRITQQARKSPGFIQGKLLFDAHLTFWTLTAWDNLASMKTFRNTGSHQRSMLLLSKWCNEACVAHWNPMERKLPSWEDACNVLKKEGHYPPLEEPSLNQSTHIVAMPLSRQYRELCFEVSKDALISRK